MLQGVKVLQLANLLPGPLACKMLQTLGADITTIEPKKGGGDPIKHYKFTPDTHSGEQMYRALNCNKKQTFQLDISHNEQEQEQFRQLCKEHDVLVYSLKPDQFEKQKLTPFDLRREFPDLIIACITGYGLPRPNNNNHSKNNSPLSSRAGHDINYLARSGVFGIGSQKTIMDDTTTTTSPTTMLQPQVVQIADIAGGTYPAVTQVLACLFQKERRQRIKLLKSKQEEQEEENFGALIDVSMTDSVRSLSLLSETTRKDLEKSKFLSSDFVENGNFILSGASPCYRFYPTSDERLIAVGCLENAYWIRFLKMLDREFGLEGGKDSLATKFSSPVFQFSMNDEKKARIVSSAILALTIQKTHQDWWKLLDQEDCMVDPVLSGEEALRSDHFQSRWGGENDKLWSDFHVNSPFRVL